MIPKETIGATAVFSAPKGWDDRVDEPCGQLSVRVERVRYRDHYISTWVPTAEEIEALRLGAHVELRLVGVQPPVKITVLDAPADAINAAEIDAQTLLDSVENLKRSLRSLKMGHKA